MSPQINNLYWQIGQNVRSARKNVGKTQSELAKALKLKRTSLTNIEQGKQRIQLHTLYAIARSLDRPITDFLPPLDVIDKKAETAVERHGEIIAATGMSSLSEKEQDRLVVFLSSAGIREQNNNEDVNENKDSSDD